MAEVEDSSSNDSVDVTSEKFDPVKALYSQKLIIPVPNAPTFDNLVKYESHLKGIVIKKSVKSEKKDVITRRHFSTVQEPVTSKCRDRDMLERGKNVLSRMGNVLGPLQVLYNCMETRTRVKIYTRSARGIRGYIEAYVAAFDKHWNLALEDCFEVWTRKVKRKAPALGIPMKSQTIDTEVPKVIVKKVNGNTETLERHVSQMLLRGEQVATIAKLNS